MLFTQQDLGVSTNAFGILNESIYIDHNTISPNTTSVIVNEDINAGIVRFSDVESISEEYGCDYIDAMIAIAESNDIDVEQLAVAVDEARIIEEPDIIYELANVVINPISENSLAYVFCESMVDAYIDSGDEGYLECIVNEKALTDYASDINQGAGEFIGDAGNKIKDVFYNITGNKKGSRYQTALERRDNAQSAGEKATSLYLNKKKYADSIGGDIGRALNQMYGERARKQTAEADRRVAKNQATLDSAEKRAKNWNTIKKNKGKIALGVAGAIGAGMAGKKLYDRYKASKTNDQAAANAQAVLKQAEGKPKSWLSKKIASLRSIYQNYLQKAREAGPNAGTFKQIAAKILSVIDALLKKLENATA